jgi:molecular chaperone HscC
MIQNAPGELSAKELEASRKKLSKLKFHPREEETNQLLIARAERLFESRLADDREIIQNSLRWFEGLLEKQNEREIQEGQIEFTDFLERFEQDRLF